MILSAGDLAFKLGGENLELCRVVNVKRDDASEDVWYDLQYCCEFTDRRDPKSIVMNNRGLRTNVPRYKVQAAEEEFVYSYLTTVGMSKHDIQYSIKGKLI